ncbi:unnamed protein product, partial [Ixodes persulcatus]
MCTIEIKCIHYWLSCSLRADNTNLKSASLRPFDCSSCVHEFQLIFRACRGVYKLGSWKRRGNKTLARRVAPFEGAERNAGNCLYRTGCRRRRRKIGRVGEGKRATALPS